MTDNTARDLSQSRRALICARVLAAVETCFPFDLSGSVFETATSLESWMGAAMSASDRLGFTRVCQLGLASLQNGHTSYHDRRVMVKKPLGFQARQLGMSGWVITSSQRVDVSVGTTISAIDDVPMATVFERMAPYISASRSGNAAAVAFFNDWLLPDDAILTFGDGKSTPLRRPEDINAPPPPPQSSFRQLDEDFGLLTIPDFGPSGTETAVAELDAVRHCRALVIDLRGNSGGNTPMALVRALHTGRIPLWQEASTLISGLERAYRGTSGDERPQSGSVTWPTESVSGDEDAFTGNIVILQDALTCSAAEDFIMPFKTTGRARIVGETSAASTGQPYFEQIDDDIRFRVAAKRVLWPNGMQFEGAGILPDTTVVPTPDDIASGRDPALAAAVDLLRT